MRNYVKVIGLLIWSFISIEGFSQSHTVFQNVPSRSSMSLNGAWKYIVDPYETGYYNYKYIPKDQSENPSSDAFFTNSTAKNKSELLEYSFDSSPTIKVPGDWNSQSDKLDYYEGTIWYRRMFDYKKKDENNRVFVNFGAVNYIAEVYLNGKKLGVHEGGFTPFSFEVTEGLKEKDNFLIVKVDNTRKKEAVPTINTDWWNYGGITRDVDLIEVPSVFVADYLVQLNPSNPNEIRGFVQFDGSKTNNQTITLSIPELKIEKKITSNEAGRAEFILPVKKINYWSPQNPKLYNVLLQSGGESIKDKIGFRTISTKGADILLNGESIFLRGICIHEEIPMGGRRAYSREDAKVLLGWAKELGCNFVRLAHYPHNEHTIRMADEMGLLVWEENPVYWTVAFHNESTYQVAKKQLGEVMERDKNRAAVVIWSMANETPQTEERLTFLSKLADFARQKDTTRLLSAALEIAPRGEDPNLYTIEDEFSKKVDVLSFNEYVGWYDGLPERCKDITWKFEENKPVIVSETGGGALQGFHADTLTRWSEEFQEDIYVKNLKMLEQIEQLRGLSPWILADFRSPKRLLPNIQDGWNRKGLIGSNGTRKKAFFTLKNHYSKIEKEWGSKK